MGGLALLVALFTTTGLATLWALRGWRRWTEAIRDLGLAYLLGAGLSVLVLSILLMLGAAPTVPTVVATTLALAALATAGGVVAGRARPIWQTGGLPPERLPLLAMAFASLTVVQLLAYFRVARRQPLEAWDAWAFWTPKAMTIYYHGGIDREAFFSFPAPTYPLVVPVLQAAAFSFVGSVDTIVVHVLFWSLAAGFIAAVAGLLRPVVPLVLLWPFLALLVVMPEFTKRAIHPQADLTLDYFFVLGALCLALWLVRRDASLLLLSAIFLAAAMGTKREGVLFSACVVAAAAVASIRTWRASWPPLALAAAAAFLTTLPWRLWLRTRDVTGDEAPGLQTDYLGLADRALPGLRLALDLLFDPDLWLIAAPVGLAAAAVLLAARRGSDIAVLYLVTMGLGVAGLTWIVWGFGNLEIATGGGATPIPRAVGALVLLSLALAPLMLWRALEHARWPT